VPPFGDIAWMIVVVALQAVPLGLSVWALLDCARRPSWAWALSGRNQAAWMASILLGVLLLAVGVAISAWYLLRVRPQVAAAEDGDLDGVGSTARDR
jgi:hypothetical protein